MISKSKEKELYKRAACAASNMGIRKKDDIVLWNTAIQAWIRGYISASRTRRN